MYLRLPTFALTPLVVRFCLLRIHHSHSWLYVWFHRMVPFWIHVLVLTTQFTTVALARFTAGCFTLRTRATCVCGSADAHHTFATGCYIAVATYVWLHGLPHLALPHSHLTFVTHLRARYVHRFFIVPVLILLVYRYGLRLPPHLPFRLRIAVTRLVTAVYGCGYAFVTYGYAVARCYFAVLHSSRLFTLLVGSAGSHGCTHVYTTPRLRRTPLRAAGLRYAAVLVYCCRTVGSAFTDFIYATLVPTHTTHRAACRGSVHRLVTFCGWLPHYVYAFAAAGYLFTRLYVTFTTVTFWLDYTRCCVTHVYILLRIHTFCCHIVTFTVCWMRLGYTRFLVYCPIHLLVTRGLHAFATLPRLRICSYHRHLRAFALLLPVQLRFTVLRLPRLPTHCTTRLRYRLRIGLRSSTHATCVGLVYTTLPHTRLPLGCNGYLVYTTTATVAGSLRYYGLVLRTTTVAVTLHSSCSSPHRCGLPLHVYHRCLCVTGSGSPRSHIRCVTVRFFGWFATRRLRRYCGYHTHTFTCRFAV